MGGRVGGRAGGWIDGLVGGWGPLAHLSCSHGGGDALCLMLFVFTHAHELVAELTWYPVLQRVVGGRSVVTFAATATVAATAAVAVATAAAGAAAICNAASAAAVLLPTADATLCGTLCAFVARFAAAATVVVAAHVIVAIGSEVARFLPLGQLHVVVVNVLVHLALPLGRGSRLALPASTTTTVATITIMVVTIMAAVTAVVAAFKLGL